MLGLREGHLVYAKGNEPELVHELRGSDVAIHCHTVALECPPHELLTQIMALAERLSDLASLSSR